MAYLALYRKYRSQTFSEVVGQSHVTGVLRNALKSGRLAHAYLFCGPRGCGKTSTARLLARALNCQSADAPTPEPCGTCSACTRIRDSAAMDVVEMDAASETGIDDVREKIVENAKYSPAECRYKVYIIDEVHDLSAKAFDSLLKTIEEPPAHVVFILATTEAHKVPITIRSRCQRLDFRRGSIPDLVANLRRVLTAENIPFEEDALSAVARAAEGSFRDSLSILEQVLAYTDAALTSEAVHAAIGVVGPEFLDRMVEVIAKDDLLETFHLASEIAAAGRDVKQTLVALQSHLRDLMVASVGDSHESLPEVSPDRFAVLRQQAQSFTPDQLLAMLQTLADCEREFRFTNQHRLLLERALWSILPSRLAAGKAGAAQPAGLPAHHISTTLHTAATPEPRPASPAPKLEITPPPSEGIPAPSEDAAGVDPQRFVGELTIEEVRRLWPRVRRALLQKHNSAAAFYTDEVEPLRLEGRTVVLGFPNALFAERAGRERARQAVELVFSQQLGGETVKVRCEVSAEVPATTPADPVQRELLPDIGVVEPAQEFEEVLANEAAGSEPDLFSLFTEKMNAVPISD